MATKTIYEENTIQFGDSGVTGLYLGMFDTVVPLAEGQEYILVWNGTEYECTAKAASFSGFDGIGIGNFALAGLGENTGEPFLLGTATDGSFTACYSTATGANTISVYLVEEDAPTVTDTLVLLDNQGIEQHLTGVKGLKVLTTGGAEQTFIAGEAVEKTVNLDFSSGDMEVTPDDGKMFSKVNIPKPETLMPEHISKGVNIAGVVGTLTSGGGYAPSRAINFYDIYGNIVYSYTRAQAAALTELPEIPEVEGFEAKEWNRTLAEVQGAVAFMDVGPRYTKNGIDVILLLLDIFSSDSVCLRFWANGWSGSVLIDWGDGSAVETKETTSSVSQYSVYHSYTTNGRYLLSIANNTLNYNGSKAGDIYLGKSGAVSTGLSNDGQVITTEASGSRSSLSHCVISCSGNAKTYSNALSEMKDLIYADVRIDGAYCIAACHRLLVNTGKNERVSLYKGNYSSCYSLRRGTGTLYGGTHYNQISAAISDHLMSSGSGLSLTYAPIKRIIITGSTAGSMTNLNTSVLEGIYVPDTAVDTFKAHSSWSAYADYIKPLSEYPDY